MMEDVPRQRQVDIFQEPLILPSEISIIALDIELKLVTKHPFGSRGRIRALLHFRLTITGRKSYKHRSLITY